MGKGKGFGKPAATTQNERIENARKFLLSFKKQAMKVEGDLQKLCRFLRNRLDKLDESLLEILPLVFDRMTANQLQKERRITAIVFSRFGDVLRNLSQGVDEAFPQEDRALHLELSRSAHQQALRICTREAFPQDWANTQISLGETYGDRLRGDRAENLEEAIAAYELALQFFTREDFPVNWVAV